MHVFLLVDIDFNNAAGFQGVPAKVTEGQFVVSIKIRV